LFAATKLYLFQICLGSLHTLSPSPGQLAKERLFSIDKQSYRSLTSVSLVMAKLMAVKRASTTTKAWELPQNGDIGFVDAAA